MKNSELHAKKTKLFCFDVFGVLHSGGSLFDGIIQAMLRYMKLGKVAIITNSTFPCASIISKMQEKGLIKGIHYDELISSGDMLIDFIKNEAYLKDYKLRIFSKELDTDLQKELSKYVDFTQNIKEAHYIYVSCIRHKAIELSHKYGISLDKLLYQDLRDEDFIFSTEELMQMKEKTFLLANTDVFVANDDGKIFVVQGFYGFHLKRMGFSNMLFFGKPAEKIYQKAMDAFGVGPENTIMFGDQISTDMIGAKNVGIKTVLIKSELSALTKNFQFLEKFRGEKFDASNVQLMNLVDVEINHIDEYFPFLEVNN